VILILRSFEGTALAKASPASFLIAFSLAFRAVEKQ